MFFMSFDNIPEYLNPLYWLSTRPASVDTLTGRIVFGVFVAVFLFGVVARVFAAKQVDKYKMMTFSRVANMLVTMGLLGALLYFFSFERIQFFGGRFWYPVWVIVLLVWGGVILNYIKKQVPRMREEARERLEKRKYLPKRKKRKK